MFSYINYIALAIGPVLGICFFLFAYLTFAYAHAMPGPGPCSPAFAWTSKAPPGPSAVPHGPGVPAHGAGHGPGPWHGHRQMQVGK